MLSEIIKPTFEHLLNEFDALIKQIKLSATPINEPIKIKGYNPNTPKIIDNVPTALPSVLLTSFFKDFSL